MDSADEKYEQIAGTLDYGLRSPKAFLNFMWALIALGVISSIIFLAGTIAAKEPLLILAVVLSPLFFCSVGGYFLVRERNHNKVIELWCEDAVELVAYTDKVYCENARMPYYTKGAVFLNPKYNQPYILNVKVKYKNEKHSYFSMSKEKRIFDSFFLKHCTYHGKMVAEYGGGKIKILYSPKYDKIMFLKGEYPKIDETAEIE